MGRTEAEVTRKVRDLEQRRDTGRLASPGKGMTVARLAWLIWIVLADTPGRVCRSGYLPTPVAEPGGQVDASTQRAPQDMAFCGEAVDSRQQNPGEGPSDLRGMSRAAGAPGRPGSAW